MVIDECGRDNAVEPVDAGKRVEGSRVRGVLDGDDDAEKFLMKCGKNTAAMSTGERAAQQMKFLLDKIADIGVHLIS